MKKEVFSTEQFEKLGGLKWAKSIGCAVIWNGKSGAECRWTLRPEVKL